MVTVPTLVVVLALAVVVWLPLGLFARDLFVKVLMARVVARYDAVCLQARTARLLEERAHELRVELEARGVPAGAVDDAVEAAQGWSVELLRAAAVVESRRQVSRDPRDPFSQLS